MFFKRTREVKVRVGYQQASSPSKPEPGPLAPKPEPLVEFAIQRWSREMGAMIFRLTLDLPLSQAIELRDDLTLAIRRAEREAAQPVVRSAQSDATRPS